MFWAFTNTILFVVDHSTGAGQTLPSFLIEMAALRALSAVLSVKVWGRLWAIFTNFVNNVIGLIERTTQAFLFCKIEVLGMEAFYTLDASPECPTCTFTFKCFGIDRLPS